MSPSLFAAGMLSTVWLQSVCPLIYVCLVPFHLPSLPRFSKDLGMVDDLLPITVFDAMQVSLGVWGMVVRGIWMYWMVDVAQRESLVGLVCFCGHVNLHGCIHIAVSNLT